MDWNSAKVLRGYYSTNLPLNNKINFVEHNVQRYQVSMETNLY